MALISVHSLQFQEKKKKQIETARKIHMKNTGLWAGVPALHVKQLQDDPICSGHSRQSVLEPGSFPADLT